MDEIRFTRSEFLARLELARPTFGRSPQRLGEFEEQAETDLPALVERAEGDLDGLSPDELEQLRTELATAYREARAAVETDEQVEALRTVAAAISRIDGEVETRAAAAEEREAALAALDAQVGSGEAEGEEGSGEDGSSEGEDEQSPEGSEGEEGSGEGSGEQAPEPATAGAAQASAPPVGRRPDLGILRRAPRQQAPADEEPGSSERPDPLAFRTRIVAAAQLPDVGQGQAFSDAEQLGGAIARMAQDLRVVGKPSDRKYYLGRTALGDRPGVVRQSEFAHMDDRSMLDEATRRSLEHKLGEARRVASGGVCVPAMPDYGLTVVGDRGTPWVDTLPGIQGNRPTNYFPWINLSLTAAAGSRVGARPDGGIGTVTAAQDAAGYGPEGDVPEGGHAYKDCVRIDCPSMIGEEPEATFRCTTVGNFAAITFPEYVRTFDEIVGFYFDVYRDERHLAKLVAAAKNLSVAGPTFGAARDLLDALRRLVAHVRSVRKAPNMAFTFAVPAFARYMIAQDLASSWASTNEGLRISAEQALGLLAVDEGIMFTEYNVSIGSTGSGEPTVLPELTDGSALPDWPEEIRIIGYPEGGVFRHDYGELSFGLRETGMATNDFSGFYEIMEQTAYRTTDLFTLDVPLCVNGATGATIAKLCGDDESA